MAPGAASVTRGPYKTGIRRREQIIEAAMTTFAEHGFVGGSVRVIADRVGVSHATLLQHFGSKEGLLTAVLEEWDRQSIEAGMTDAAGLDYFRQMPQVMKWHIAHRGLLELFITMAAEASSSDHPAHDFIQNRYAHNVATLTGHLQQAADVGHVAPLTPAQVDIEVRIVTAVLDGIALQWLNDPSTDIVKCVATFIDRTIADWSRR